MTATEEGSSFQELNSSNDENSGPDDDGKEPDVKLNDDLPVPEGYMLGVGLTDVASPSFLESRSNPDSPLIPKMIEVSNQNLGQSTSALSSSNTSRISSPTKARLDERSQTRISKLLQHHTDLNLAKKTDSATASASSLDNFYGYDDNSADNKIFKWLKMKKLNEVLYSDEVRLKYGIPHCVFPAAMIAFGTSKGFVLIFDYNQNIKFILGQNLAIAECGNVTVVAFSADSTYVVSGHQRGDIFLWDLSKSYNPILHIKPITHDDRFKHGREGHLTNVPVHQLSFIGKRHTAFISADISGLVFHHNGYRNVFGYHAITRKILGKTDISGEPSTTIFGCATLPLGSSIEPTDDMGLIAVMTPNILAIVSTSPKLVTQFKVGRPKLIQEDLGFSGCLAWFPAVKSKDYELKSLPKLAYCWSNVLTILEMNQNLSGDDSSNFVLQFKKSKRWVGQECIVSVSWLNSKVILLLTSSQHLIVINSMETTVISYVDLMSKHVFHKSLFPSKIPKISEFYNNSVKTFKGKIFLMGRYSLYIGNSINWTDKLMFHINNGSYIAALEEARKYYTGEADLIILGLPTSDASRHKLVKGYLIEIMNSLLTYVFKNESFENSQEKKTFLFRTLNVCLHVCTCIEDDHSLITILFDKYIENGERVIFYDTLEPLIFGSDLQYLPPLILKDMVEYYASEQKCLVLEELICLLDISSIDIDFAIQLCTKHHLRDTSIYIWTVLLHDYITPLADYIKDIKSSREEDFCLDEKKRLSTECSTVFTYISYILTGRQYPTDKAIELQEATKAKLNIYYLLFNGTSLSWPPGSPKLHISNHHDSEPAFPYLYLLLKYDCLGLLATLNEAFEDSILNEDEVSPKIRPYESKVSRQYVVDVLLDLFDSREDFSNRDKCELSIFIARNYPKYTQFLRLSESTLDKVIENLCAYDDDSMKVECELALLSLLSAYRSPNITELIGSFKLAGFSDVLYNIYKSEAKYSKLLEVCILRSGRQLSYNEALISTIEMCLNETKIDRTERSLVEKLISNNFEQLCKEEIDSLVPIIEKYCSTLHKCVFSISNDSQYKYLKTLFELKEDGNNISTISKDIVLAYLERLCEYNKTAVFYFMKLNLHLLDIHETESLRGKLKSYDVIDGLILLYEVAEEYIDAFNEILSYYDKLGVQLFEMIENDDDSKYSINAIEDEFWKFLTVAMAFCENEKSKITKSKDTDLFENERMWLDLILHNVNLVKQIETRLPPTPNLRQLYILHFSKRLIQESFTRLIEIRSKDKLCSVSNSSFLRIFSHFLDKSSLDVTNFDVRSIVQELFLAYRHKTEMLQTVLKILNDNVFKRMELLYAQKLCGWTTNKVCASCGKKIWGMRISQDNNIAWEAKRRDNLIRVLGEEHSLYGEKYDNNLFKNSELVMFKCHHGYHMACLNNLGFTSRKDFRCVLCVPE